MQITTLPPVSRNGDWIDCFKFIDDETGDALNISDATEITIEIFDTDDCSAKLTATLTGGTIAHIETGVFQWTFTRAQMQTLDPKTYDVNGSIVKDGITLPIFIGSLPVFDRYSGKRTG